MAKHTHRIRVWAHRRGRRSLELSVDRVSARSEAMARVEALKVDPDVAAIEMVEHVVVHDDAAGVERGRRGMLRWRRTERGWRQLPG